MLWVAQVENVNVDVRAEEPALLKPTVSARMHATARARASSRRRPCRHRATSPSSSLSLGQWAVGRWALGLGSGTWAAEG